MDLPTLLLSITSTMLTWFFSQTLGGKVLSYPCAPPCGCVKHNQTLTINCTARALHEFPQDIPSASEYRLIMARNKLSTFTVNIYLDKITHLDLSDNVLSDIKPHAIFILQKKIRVLQLHNNQLQHIPQQLAVTSFEHLQKLTLHGNPIVCDCKSKWLKHWLNNASHIVNREGVVCRNRKLYGRPVMEVPDDMFPCQLKALEDVGKALGKMGNPAVILVIFILAILFIWSALFVMYRKCKTSSEIKWIEGAKWTALVDTE